MKTYDIICPICGGMNRELDLEETDGFMECEACFTIQQVPRIRKNVMIPVYDWDCNNKEHSNRRLMVVGGEV